MVHLRSVGVVVHVPTLRLHRGGLVVSPWNCMKWSGSVTKAHSKKSSCLKNLSRLGANFTVWNHLFLTCDHAIVKRSSVMRRPWYFFTTFGSFSCSEPLLRKVWLAHRGLYPFRPFFRGTAREPARAAQCHRNSAIGPLLGVQVCTWQINPIHKGRGGTHGNKVIKIKRCL